MKGTVQHDKQSSQGGHFNHQSKEPQQTESSGLGLQKRSYSQFESFQEGLSSSKDYNHTGSQEAGQSTYLRKTGQFGDDLKSSYNQGRATMARFADDQINRRNNRFTVGHANTTSGPHVSIEDCPVMLGIKADVWQEAVNEYQQK